MRKVRSAVLVLLSVLALVVGSAGMATAAKAATVKATGDGTVTQQGGPEYHFNFSGQTGGKGGFTIFNTADRKNLVTAGKTICFSQINADTVAIVGTASNKNTDEAFNTSDYVLIIATDAGDAIYIAGTNDPICPTKIPAGVNLTPISSGDITITP